ncbi:MAG TPA: SufS family cysteine desulfurase [Acidimicrobiia bacterium]|nr:SufS family cysteine desulfurase [Acidimicrobiia bacterium]
MLQDHDRTRTGPLANQYRPDFPAFAAGAGHFLDSAASSLKPQAVIDAMAEFSGTLYANVHRGAYRLSMESTERYEAARIRLGGFLNTRPEQVVLTRGTTTGLNMVASGWGGTHLREGDRILLTHMEHHANLIPWQMVAKRTGAVLDFVPLTTGFTLDLDAYAKLLESKPKVVALTGMSNVLGTIPPLTEMAAAAHHAGALVVVDGAQLVPHRAVDVESLGADFLAFSSHKMLGPTGIGVLWGRPDRLEEMEPFEGGGEMIADVQLDSSTWAAVPHRFEAGTPPIIEAVGFDAAVEYLGKIGMERVAAHDTELTAYALDRLGQNPLVSVQGPPTVAGRGGAISFTLGDVHAHDLATILDQQGVSVRAGHHCAKPLMRVLGVPATARASFSVYSTKEDVDALVEGLETAARLFGI